MLLSYRMISLTCSQSYFDVLNDAVHHYNEDRWPQCVETCTRLLREAGGNLSRYVRIRLLILAAAASDQFWDAERWRMEAEARIDCLNGKVKLLLIFHQALWLHGRRMFPKRPTTQDPLIEASIKPEPHYADDSVEAALQDLREELDELVCIVLCTSADNATNLFPGHNSGGREEVLRLWRRCKRGTGIADWCDPEAWAHPNARRPERADSKGI
jgi:hypothetical protein